jgi:hypothetical protein
MVPEDAAEKLRSPVTVSGSIAYGAECRRKVTADSSRHGLQELSGTRSWYGPPVVFSVRVTDTGLTSGGAQALYLINLRACKCRIECA